MGWKVRFGKAADKQFTKLDPQTRQEILNYAGRLEKADDPTQFGKPLMGELAGYWRYRVGKYRLICELQKKILIIEVIRIGKRDSVYD